MKLLVELGNLITHFRPRNVQSGEEMAIQKKVGSRFPVTRLLPPDSGNPWFPDKCLGVGCALWAVSTAAKFAKAFYDRLGLAPPDKTYTWFYLPPEEP